MKAHRNLILVLAISTSWLLPAFSSLAAAEEAKQRKFIGVARCKICHQSEKMGDQYAKWLASPHSKAFETLASEAAKAIAKDQGIEDPQASTECLKCHVTGHDVPEEFLDPKFKKEDGIGCESCHGAGGDYYKMKTMKGLYAGEIDPASVGLLEPNKELCVSCHNEKSPTYKEFVFEERFKQIAHPMPEK